MRTIKKPLKTIEETSKGKNIKTINIKTLTVKENKELIKKVKAGGVPGYHVVKPKNIDEYIRSNPDRKKINNLDPKIGILPKTRKK